MSLGETGSVTIGTGVVVLVIGAFLLYDSALIISGNILITIGFLMLFRSKTQTLLSIDKIQGTSIFILGLGVLLFRYALFGVILEIAGLLMIFKSSIPNPKSLLYRILFRKTVPSIIKNK